MPGIGIKTDIKINGIESKTQISTRIPTNTRFFTKKQKNIKRKKKKVYPANHAGITGYQHIEE